MLDLSFTWRSLGSHEGRSGKRELTASWVWNEAQGSWDLTQKYPGQIQAVDRSTPAASRGERKSQSQCLSCVVCIYIHITFCVCLCSHMCRCISVYYFWWIFLDYCLYWYLNDYNIDLQCLETCIIVECFGVSYSMLWCCRLRQRRIFKSYVVKSSRYRLIWTTVRLSNGTLSSCLSLCR